MQKSCYITRGIPYGSWGRIDASKIICFEKFKVSKFGAIMIWGARLKPPQGKFTKCPYCSRQQSRCKPGNGPIGFPQGYLCRAKMLSTLVPAQLWKGCVIFHELGSASSLMRHTEISYSVSAGRTPCDISIGNEYRDPQPARAPYTWRTFLRSDAPLAHSFLEQVLERLASSVMYLTFSDRTTPVLSKIAVSLALSALPDRQQAHARCRALTTVSRDSA